MTRSASPGPIWSSALDRSSTSPAPCTRIHRVCTTPELRYRPSRFEVPPSSRLLRRQDHKRGSALAASPHELGRTRSRAGRSAEEDARLKSLDRESLLFCERSDLLADSDGGRRAQVALGAIFLQTRLGLRFNHVSDLWHVPHIRDASRDEERQHGVLVRKCQPWASATAIKLDDLAANAEVRHAAKVGSDGSKRSTGLIPNRVQPS